jgi:hypothetical protein
MQRRLPIKLFEQSLTGLAGILRQINVGKLSPRFFTFATIFAGKRKVTNDERTRVRRPSSR